MRISNSESMESSESPKDVLSEYIYAPAAESDGTYYGTIRAGLAELARLAGERVDPLVEQIESQWQQDSGQARQRYRQQLEADEQSHQQRVAEWAAKRDRDRAANQKQYDQRRGEVTHQGENRLAQLESAARAKLKAGAQDRDYELMTAETVARESTTKAKRDYKMFKETILPQADEMMAELEGRAQGLLEVYRRLLGPEAEAAVDVEGDLPEDAAGAFRRGREETGAMLDKLEGMIAPRLCVGVWPFLLPVLIVGGAVGVAWILDYLQVGDLPEFGTLGPAAGIGAGVLTAGAGWLVRARAVKASRAIWRPLRIRLAQTRQDMALHVERTERQYEQIFADIKARREQTVAEQNEKYQALKTQVTEELERQQGAIRAEMEEALGRLARDYEETERRLETQSQQARTELEEALGRRRAELQAQFEQETAQQRESYEGLWARLIGRWQAGLERVEAMRGRLEGLDESAGYDWRHEYWTNWQPSGRRTGAYRLGELAADWQAVSETVSQRLGVDWRGQGDRAVPLLLEFPQHGSVFFEYGREGREEAMSALRSVTARLALSLPPGQARFTLVDPVGLGENFAGFMHLADYEEALIGGRIWTESQQIQQQFSDLTGHMENVIQKYLRNEYETIDAYNEQAGELAEPYRFLVIADFPAKISEEAARRLSSIIASGPRCGVFTLIARDSREKLPQGVRQEDLRSHSIGIRYREGGFVCDDEILGQTTLRLDRAMGDELLTTLMQRVGRGARDTNRVEVPFESIAPREEQVWTLHNDKVLTVPVGRSGATRRQQFSLGKGVAQHALIGGKTGSGKSTLLHVLITNLALWYSPDEVELYLIDFKKGVEFKPYVTWGLPHARAVAIESDREFGLSILRQIEAEMTRRGELFRQRGVQDLAGWRSESGTALARILLVVDEFQVFFGEDDKLAQDAALLLEQLVRQGRAFGIHVVLGSQTLAGTSGLARGTLGQIGVRVALQCSEIDSQLILDDNNTAARLLGRPGEAIYNDAGGQVQGNSPFQVSWLTDEQRDGYLSAIRRRYEQEGRGERRMIVFEGNVPSDIRKNRPLAEALKTRPTEMPLRSGAWIGEPVAIKEPTAVVFQRHSGSNALIVGQRDQAALAMLAAMQISLAGQYPAEGASFYVFDGMPADSTLAGQLPKIARYVPQTCRAVNWREVEGVVAQIAEEVSRRHEGDVFDAPAIYVLVFGLQRYRMLRRSEDDFSFSMDDAPKAAKPDKQFSEILREGPAVGVHTVVWADTMATLERTFDRTTLREFDNRILFQISAADSSNLIDTPAANQLGQYRALLYSEEHGTIEKFRPYAMAPEEWLGSLGLV